MKVFTAPNTVPVKAWVDGVEFEESAREQTHNLASMPFIYKHVAVMPDVHWGMGATVGSVIATKGAIIPAAVGVDIGCGMIAAKLKLPAELLPDSLVKIRSEIERMVPHGRTDNGGPSDRGAWHDIPKDVEDGLSVLGLGPLFKHERLKKYVAKRDPRSHLATLGTGNHFIELCLDQENRVWVMLHSGSRGIGNCIGQTFIEKAKEKMREYWITLPDADLAYLPDGSQEFKDYIEAVQWAQNYAALNRELMLGRVVLALGQVLGFAAPVQETVVSCHHNYISREHHFGENVWVTRKGAVRARLGDRGIIPGSMGVRSYIVKGLGNVDSFHSCSHGAGRRMSRGQARRIFSVEDHVKATTGVECRKDKDVLDETPGAYKDIDAVMEAQKDLVEIEYTLKQVLCVKG